MRTTININENSVIVTTEEGGVRRVKSISPQDLVSLLCREKPLDSGALPKHCMRYISRPTITVYHIWVPSHKGLIKLRPDSDAIEVPFPPVLMILRYTPDLGSSKAFCTLPEFRTEEDTNLYHFPYGNVGPDGEICWGSVIRDRRRSRASVDRVVAQMLGSCYNTDLGRYIAGIPRRDHDELDEYITEEVSGMNEFPTSRLEYYRRFTVNSTGDLIRL